MKKCSSCGREIKSSNERWVEITINNKKRIYCSECQQKSEVKQELKAVKGLIRNWMTGIIIGVILVLTLIGLVIFWVVKKMREN